MFKTFIYKFLMIYILFILILFIIFFILPEILENSTLILHTTFIITNLIFGRLLRFLNKDYTFKIYLYYGIVISYFNIVIMYIFSYLIWKSDIFQLTLKNLSKFYWYDNFIVIYSIFFIPIGSKFDLLFSSLKLLKDR